MKTRLERYGHDTHTETRRVEFWVHEDGTITLECDDVPLPIALPQFRVPEGEEMLTLLVDFPLEVYEEQGRQTATEPRWEQRVVSYDGGRCVATLEGQRPVVLHPVLASCLFDHSGIE